MRVLVVVGHPDPESFNHAIARTVTRELGALGHDMWLTDLYAEGFDAGLPAGEIPEGGTVDPVVQGHCQRLADAEGIVVVHPNWWGSPPALVKGWIDRVFRPGVAYRFLEGDGGEGVPLGLLRARTAVVFNTANTGERREVEVFGDPLENIWRNCVFRLCGVEDVRRRTFGIVVTSTPAQRRAWLAEVREIVRSSFPRDDSPTLPPGSR